jgi:hypothetical protein
MGKRIFNIPQHNVAGTAITDATTWVAVGVATENPLRQPLFCNYTNAYIEFSIDGASPTPTIAFTLAPGLAWVDDITSNAKTANHMEDGPMLNKGAIIKVRQSSLFPLVGTPSGAVLVSGFYEYND